MISLRQILKRISIELPEAQQGPIKGHPLVNFVEKEAVHEIMSLLSLGESDDLFVKASLRACSPLTYKRGMGDITLPSLYE